LVAVQVPEGKRKWNLVLGGSRGRLLFCFLIINIVSVKSRYADEAKPQRALANRRNMRTYVFDYLFHEFAAHFTWKINKEAQLNIDEFQILF